MILLQLHIYYRKIISTTKTWSKVLLLLMGFYCMEVRSNIVMDVHNLDKDLTATEANKKFFWLTLIKTLICWYSNAEIFQNLLKQNTHFIHFRYAIWEQKVSVTDVNVLSNGRTPLISACGIALEWLKIKRGECLSWKSELMLKNLNINLY